MNRVVLQKVLMGSSVEYVSLGTLRVLSTYKKALPETFCLIEIH